MIVEYAALKEVKRKVIVHDAAAPMKAAIPLLTVGGCSSLLCGDHLLNTVLSKAINKTIPLKRSLILLPNSQTKSTNHH